MKNNELLSVAVDAAEKAGKLLRKGLGTSFQISKKSGKHNLVTEYDHASEKIIIETILKAFPSHGILAEESGPSKTGEILWIIDPLDGTVNFAHGIPVFSVSIAATRGEEILCGVVYQPITEELFTAEKGKGAFFNGQKMQVTDTTDINAAFLATGFPYNVDQNPLHCIDTFSNMTKKGIPIRRLGSAAIDLAYVAAGRFDAYWEVSLEPWDLAGGKLLVEEAGGKVTDYEGRPRSLRERGPILATNGRLKLELV
ncbi:MAG: inositol monophosphatase [Verrucomicrobia bacterium]|nr:inositol monophosphatase [Verrucomicrobiota bacterium]